MVGPKSRGGFADALAGAGKFGAGPCTDPLQRCGNVLLAQADGVMSAIGDPVLSELCNIFCPIEKDWVACKKKNGPGKCAKPSPIAKTRTKAALGKPGSGLNRAVKSRFPGGVGRAEKSFLALVDKTAAKVLDGARKVYDEAAFKRALERKVKKIMKQEAADFALKKAKKAWMKLVPGLNVLSTIVDVVDGVMTAADVIKQIRSLSGLTDKAIRIQPDFAIEGQNGAVEKIYDYKFDGDNWQKGQKQLEAYTAATGDAPTKVDAATCGCDGKPKQRGLGGIA